MDSLELQKEKKIALLYIQIFVRFVKFIKLFSGKNSTISDTFLFLIKFSLDISKKK